MRNDIRVLRESEIRKLLDPASCREAVEEAFAAQAAGGAVTPGVIHLDFPERLGEVHVKAGFLRGGAFYAVKIASGFPGNTQMGLPAGDGMILVFRADTGEPAALLLDNGFITDLRTGAAGAVAAMHLARRDARVVGVVGCGSQARYQLEALALVRPFREVRIWGRDTARARACASEVAGRSGTRELCRFSAVGSVREAVEGADIVLTVTSSREPLVRAEWLYPGVHITAVGSDGPDKRELFPEVLARADRVVADSLSQCLRLGEIHHAVAAGALREGEVDAELGEIVSGLKPGRQGDLEITVCDLTGLGIQDVAAAARVLDRAGAGDEKAGNFLSRDSV
jgi:ectoine utilization protein EutC